MAEPQNALQFELVSQADMDRLLVEHKIREKLPLCKQELIETEKTEAELKHDVFCCRHKKVRYLDANTDTPVALVAHYTRISGEEYDIFSWIRVSNKVFVLKLP